MRIPLGEHAGVEPCNGARFVSGIRDVPNCLQMSPIRTVVGASRAKIGVVAEDVSPDTRLKAGRGGEFPLGLSTNRRRNGLTGPSYATPASTPQHRIANPTRTSGVPKAETLLPGLFSPKPS